MSNNAPVFSEGYVVDTQYANKLQPELSPGWINYAAALNDCLPINLSQSFTYLELGCGFGKSVISNAAEYPTGIFHACDLNPDHIHEARENTRQLEIGNLFFHEMTFQNLVKEKLPKFDFIVLHGVYSWVGADTRDVIHSIIRGKLKPGGFVYLSYNCLPGWSAEVPVRRLMKELAETESGNTEQRLGGVLEMLRELNEAELRYFKATPSLQLAIESYQRGPISYVAHEFLNEAWQPFYSIDIADAMTTLGLTFAGSATLVDNHEILLVAEKQAKLINGLHNKRQQQLVSDFALNRSFRRDVFCNSAEILSADKAEELLQKVLIRRSFPTIKNAIRVPRGEIGFQSQFIEALQNSLQGGEKTISQIVQKMEYFDTDSRQIFRNLHFLIAGGELRAKLIVGPAVS